MRRWIPILLLALGCGSDNAAEEKKARVVGAHSPAPRRVQAPRILVDQILIAFKGAKPYGDATERSRAEAKKLARSLIDRIEAGVPFATLKKEYSDYRLPKSDSIGGPVTACNAGVRPRQWEVPFDNLYRGWRNTAFALEVGQIGLVEYDTKDAPEGYTILYRLR